MQILTILWDIGLGLSRSRAVFGDAAVTVLIMGVLLVVLLPARRVIFLNIGNSPRFAGPPVDFLGTCFVRPMAEGWLEKAEVEFVSIVSSFRRRLIYANSHEF